LNKRNDYIRTLEDEVRVLETEKDSAISKLHASRVDMDLLKHSVRGLCEELEVLRKNAPYNRCTDYVTDKIFPRETCFSVHKSLEKIDSVLQKLQRDVAFAAPALIAPVQKLFSEFNTVQMGFTELESAGRKLTTLLQKSTERRMMQEANTLQRPSTAGRIGSQLAGR
jgi:hypothetical protein